ncbi:MAG: ABC transporter permease [Chlorobiales bacterium]|nr:ABC transporter permease [Chlorobiales bacterium]
MTGLFRIAFKLLVNDRSKFTALLVGITFAVFLMVMMMSMFSGILSRSCAPVYNIGAKVWVMDPAVNNTVSSIPMPDYVLSSARSIKGVSYAVPLYYGGAQVKLRNGSYQSVTVIGLDDTTLFGRPELIEGRIEDIFASSGLFGVPTLYTTFSRAITYIPTTRFTTSFVLIEPRSTGDIPGIQREIAKLGYEALTRQQFVDKITAFYTYKTGMGTNILLMTSISFLVGLSISGQTFYTFILENLEKFGAMKAIGAKGRELVTMILFQAFFTSLTGYGLGVGAASSFMLLMRMRMPDYAAQLTFSILGFALLMVTIIAGVSSYIGVRKVLQIQPFDIFRG